MISRETVGTANIERLENGMPMVRLEFVKPLPFAEIAAESKSLMVEMVGPHTVAPCPAGIHVIFDACIAHLKCEPNLDGTVDMVYRFDSMPPVGSQLMTLLMGEEGLAEGRKKAN